MDHPRDRPGERYSNLLRLLCGSLGSLYQILEDAAYFLADYGYTPELSRLRDIILNDVLARFWRQRMWGGNQLQDPNTPLLSLMQTYRDAKCADIRDKLFGLHSIALSCCRKSVPIDYTRSTYNLCGMILAHHFYHHSKDGATIVSQSEDLHRRLRGQTLESTAECPHFDREETNFIEVAGRLRGVAYFVSGPLRNPNWTLHCSSLSSSTIERIERQLKQNIKMCKKDKLPSRLVTKTIYRLSTKHFQHFNRLFKSVRRGNLG